MTVVSRPRGRRRRRIGAACSTRSMPAIGRGAGGHRDASAAASSHRLQRPSSTPPKIRRSWISTLFSRSSPRRRSFPQAEPTRDHGLQARRNDAAHDHSGAGDVNLGRRPSATARPVQGEPGADELRAALDPLIKANDAGGAEAQLLPTRRSCRPRLAPKRASVLPSSITSSASTWTRAASPTHGARARPANGPRSRRGFPVSPRGGSAIANLRREPSSRRPPTRSSVSSAPARFYWAARSEQACGRPRAVAAAAEGCGAHPPESFYGLVARETLGIDTKLPQDPLHRLRPAHRPTAQRPAREELVKIGEPALAEEMLRHQAKIGLQPSIMRSSSSRRSSIFRRRSCGSPTMDNPGLAPTPPTAIPTRVGARSTAGGSIRRSPSATSSRNRPFAALPSARLARSA